MNTISDGATSAAGRLLSEVTSLLERHPEGTVDRQTIDDIEQTAHRALSLLRQRFNATNPTHINSVPPELLRRVFELLREPSTEYPDLSASHSVSTLYMPLTAPMLVCHKWYRVAREHAALWTDISLELTARHGLQPRWDAHLLEWSKRASIDLRLEFMAAQADQCESILQQHGCRIRRLELFTVCVASVHEMPRMLSALLNPTHLTRLFLSLPNAMEMGTPHIRADAGPMLCLRELVLDRVVWIPAHPLPSLVDIRMMGIQPLRHEQLSALLSLAPSSEALHLAAFMFDPSRPPETSTLNLRRLRTLTLTGISATDVQQLMARLVLPAVEDTQIRKLTLNINSRQPLLSRPLPFSSDPILRLDVIAPNSFHEGSGKRLSFIAEGERSTFSIVAMPHGNTDWDMSWLLAVPTALRLDSLTSCRLQLSHWKWKSLPAFARHVPNLRHLVVQSLWDDGGVTVVGEALLVPELSSLLGEEDSVLCPELESLGIRLHYIEELSDYLPRLVAALAGRVENGHRLRRLLVCVDDPSLSSEFVATEGSTHNLKKKLLKCVERVKLNCIPEELWPGEP